MSVCVYALGAAARLEKAAPADGSSGNLSIGCLGGALREGGWEGGRVVWCVRARGDEGLDGDNGRMVDEGLMEAGTDVEGAMDEGML